MEGVRSYDLIDQALTKVKGVDSILGAISNLEETYTLQDRNSTCVVLQDILSEVEDKLMKAMECLEVK